MTQDNQEGTFPALKMNGYQSPISHQVIQELHVHKHLSLYVRPARELHY